MQSKYWKENPNSQINGFEQALGNGGEEELPISRKRPGSGMSSYVQLPAGMTGEREEKNSEHRKARTKTVAEANLVYLYLSSSHTEVHV